MTSRSCKQLPGWNSLNPQTFTNPPPPNRKVHFQSVSSLDHNVAVASEQKYRNSKQQNDTRRLYLYSDINQRVTFAFKL